MLEFIKITVTLSNSFVDCGEPNMKLEIKEEEEETLNEDPLSIKMKSENAEETVKQEIEEDIQDKNLDDDKINTIDIVHHKI